MKRPSPPSFRRSASIACGIVALLGLLSGCFAKAHYTANLDEYVDPPAFECDVPIAKRVRWIHQELMLDKNYYNADGRYQAALAAGEQVEFPTPTRSIASLYAETDPAEAARLQAASEGAADQLRGYQTFQSAASLPQDVAGSSLSAEAGLASAVIVAFNQSVAAAGRNLNIADIESIVGYGVPRCMVGDDAPEGTELYVWLYESTTKGTRHGAQYESLATAQLRLVRGDEVIQAPTPVVEVLLYRKRSAVPSPPVEGFIERDFYQGKQHHQRSVTRGALEVGLRSAAIELYQAVRAEGRSSGP